MLCKEHQQTAWIPHTHQIAVLAQTRVLGHPPKSPFQHSPMLGHCASSQTVASLRPRICSNKAEYFSPCGARCRNQGGLLELGRLPKEGPSILLASCCFCCAAAAACCSRCFCSCCSAKVANEGSFSTAMRTSSANASVGVSVSGAAALHCKRVCSCGCGNRTQRGLHATVV